MSPLIGRLVTLTASLATAVLVCVPATTAVARSTWETPTTVGAIPVAAPGAGAADVAPVQVAGRCGTRLGISQLVTDRRGVSTATWGCAQRIYAARTDRDGGWRPAVAIGTGLEPRAVVDRRGRVTVLYRRLQGNGIESRRWAAGAWQRPVDLTWQTGADVVFVQWYSIATNARGDTVAVWTQNDGEVLSGPTPRMVAAFRPFDGPWTPTVRIAPRGYADGALVDAAGRVVVVPELYRRTATGRWRHPVVPPMEGRFGGAAVDPAGDLLVSRMPSGGSGAVLAYEKPYGEPWHPGVQVGTTGAPIGQARTVLGASGRAAVSYPAGGSARVAVRPADGGWAPPVQVSASGVRAGAIRLVAGPAGALAVSWTQGNDYVERQLWVSILPTGGDWTPPIQVTGARWRHVDHTSTSFRPNGSVVAAWTGKVAGRPGWRFATRVVTAPAG